MAAVEGDGGEVSEALAPQMPSGEQTVWADVSALIDAACNDLQDGELIHGENFSLFAAMSALEVMDPKMDSGMKSSAYNSIEEAIECGTAPIPLSADRTLDVQRTIDVMDHLLACEATWHKGHSLSQTVFSCIYLLQFERISSHALLHSYCRITRATCNVVISTVSEARTHEEEDIFTAAYGLPLKVDGDDKCLSVINSVEEVLSRQLRACKVSSPNKNKKSFGDVESLQDNADLEEGYCKALLCRLRFRKYFYHVLMCMGKPQGRGLMLARKHIVSCLSEMNIIRKSLQFLNSSAYGSCQSDKDRTTASGCQPVGFDASLNSKLSTPTPPRAIKIVTWIEAIEYFEKLLHDLDIVCSCSLDPLLEAVLQFVVQFQKLKPDLVARAYLQRLLVQDGKLFGRESFSDIITGMLVSPNTARNQLRIDFHQNAFLKQLEQLLINLLKILCTNAAWQRRKLGKILQDWSVISAQLELACRKEFGEVSNVLVEENVNARMLKRLAIWEQEQTYWIASRFLLLGFELELYSPSEYCMVYWYMYFVFSKHLEMVQLREASNSNSHSLQRKGKKKREPSKNVTKDARVSPTVLLLQCYNHLSEGLGMMMAALANERKCFPVPSVFNSEQERFNQHFELLQKAHVPNHISYYVFKESTINVRTSMLVKYDCFRDAQRISRLLRESFSNDPEKLAELRQMENVAEYNRIALNVINQAGVLDSSLRISFEFSHHPCFAVAVVRRS